MPFHLLLSGVILWFFFSTWFQNFHADVSCRPCIRQSLPLLDMLSVLPSAQLAHPVSALMSILLSVFWSAQCWGKGGWLCNVPPDGISSPALWCVGMASWGREEAASWLCCVKLAWCCYRPSHPPPPSGTHWSMDLGSGNFHLDFSCSVVITRPQNEQCGSRRQMNTN